MRSALEAGDLPQRDACWRARRQALTAATRLWLRAWSALRAAIRRDARAAFERIGKSPVCVRARGPRRLDDAAWEAGERDGRGAKSRRSRRQGSGDVADVGDARVRTRGARRSSGRSGVRRSDRASAHTLARAPATARRAAAPRSRRSSDRAREAVTQRTVDEAVEEIALVGERPPPDPPPARLMDRPASSDSAPLRDAGKMLLGVYKTSERSAPEAMFHGAGRSPAPIATRRRFEWYGRSSPRTGHEWERGSNTAGLAEVQRGKYARRWRRSRDDPPLTRSRSGCGRAGSSAWRTPLGEWDRSARTAEALTGSAAPRRRQAGSTARGIEEKLGAKDVSGDGTRRRSSYKSRVRASWARAPGRAAFDRDSASPIQARGASSRPPRRIRSPPDA